MPSDPQSELQRLLREMEGEPGNHRGLMREYIRIHDELELQTDAERIEVCKALLREHSGNN